jgi:hypothetical protein
MEPQSVRNYRSANANLLRTDGPSSLTSGMKERPMLAAPNKYKKASYSFGINSCRRWPSGSEK